MLLVSTSLLTLEAKATTRTLMASGVILNGVTEKAIDGTNIRTFKGITYAKANRWEPPKQYNYPKGQHDMSKFGAVCPQNIKSGDPEVASFAKEFGMKEDCLNLNIWTPTANPRSKLPTIVWIHGGGFKSGVAYKKTYQGANMAARGVVFVSLNYRLNLFGFFAHKGQPRNAPVGNYGIFDQTEALRWIKRNIVKFGGDPNNVTLMGESAGAMSVLTHLQNSHSDSLFHKAIVQSSPALLKTTPIHGKNESDSPTAVDSSKLLAKKLKCENSNTSREFDCLKKRSTDSVLNLASGNGAVNSGLYIDYYSVTQSFHKTFTTGKFQNKPIIIGSNKDEATFFGPAPFKRPIQYKFYLFSEFGRNVARDLISEYPANSIAQMQENWIQFYTDFMFTFDGLTIAEQGAKNGRRKIYHYYFSRVGQGAHMSGKGASHGFEIPYFLDNLESIGAPSFAFNHIDADISNEMASRIVTFSKTGNPSYQQGVSWSPYNASSKESLEINSRIKETFHLLKDRMEVIKSSKYYKLR